MKTIFNQQNQKVAYQFNLGEINFSNVQDLRQMASILRKLMGEVERAQVAGVLDPEIAVDVRHQIESAAIQTEKSIPEKTKVIGHLEKARSLITDVTAAAGMVEAIGKAAEIVSKLFS